MIPSGIELIGVVIRGLHVDKFNKMDAGENITIGGVLSYSGKAQLAKAILVL